MSIVVSMICIILWSVLVTHIAPSIFSFSVSQVDFEEGVSGTKDADEPVFQDKSSNLR